MTSLIAVQRIRSFCFAAIGVAYYYAARAIAEHAANGLASADWFDLVYRVLVLFLVMLGLGVMAFVFQRQRQPFVSMGLVRRPGWTREFGLGTAIGWGLVVATVLPTVLLGGLYASAWTAPRQWFLLVLDALVLLTLALTQEIVLRGYAFQRLIDAVGDGTALFLIALLAAILELGNGFAPRAGMVVAFFLNWLLCVAYLRTRALWLPWGLRFAWFAATSLVFGLPIGGVSRYTPVIQSTVRGPLWLTGGDYGPEAAVVTIFALIAAFYFLIRTTREYAHKYAVAEILPAGVPVDIDALAKRQHQMGMGPAAASAESSTPKLVQIGAPIPPQGVAPIAIVPAREGESEE